MTDPKPSPNHRTTGTLKTPSPTKRREVMIQWRRAEGGMDGERAGLPVAPDDAVAFQLLEAADAAMSRGDWKQGANILKLVVQDYRQSQEAAFARCVLDRLAETRSRQR